MATVFLSSLLSKYRAVIFFCHLYSENHLMISRLFYLGVPITVKALNIVYI